MLRIILVLLFCLIFHVEAYCFNSNGVTICIKTDNQDVPVNVDYNPNVQLMGSKGTIWISDPQAKTIQLNCNSYMPVQWFVNLSKLDAQTELPISYIYNTALQNGTFEKYQAILNLRRSDDITGLYTCAEFSTHIGNRQFGQNVYSYSGETKIYLYGGTENARLLNEGKLFEFTYMNMSTKIKSANGIRNKNLFDIFGHAILTSYPRELLLFQNDALIENKTYDIWLNFSNPWANPKFEKMLADEVTLTYVKVSNIERPENVNSVSLSIVGDMAPEIELISPSNPKAFLLLADKENSSFSCQSRNHNNYLEIDVLNKPSYINIDEISQENLTQPQQIVIYMNGNKYNNKSEILTIRCRSKNNKTRKKSWAYDVYYKNSTAIAEKPIQIQPNGKQVKCFSSNLEPLQIVSKPCSTIVECYSIGYHKFARGLDQQRLIELYNSFGNIISCLNPIEYYSDIIYPENGTMKTLLVNQQIPSNPITIEPETHFNKSKYKIYDHLTLICKSSKLLTAGSLRWKIQFSNQTLDLTETNLYYTTKDTSDILNYNSKLTLVLRSEEISAILCSAEFFHVVPNLEIRNDLPYYNYTRIELKEEFASFPIQMDYSLTTAEVDLTLPLSLTASFIILIGVGIFMFNAFWVRKRMKDVVRLTKVEIECFQSGKLCKTFNNWEKIDLGPYDKKKYEISRHRIFVDRTKILGSGEFGEVVEGLLSEKKKKIRVAVKMPKLSDSKDAFLAMLDELSVMIHANGHPNVVELLGAYTKELSQGKLFMIVELCEHSSLENYIKKNRHLFYNELIQNGHTQNFVCPNSGQNLREQQYVTIVETENPDLLYIRDLFIWTQQIASAMEYLHKKTIIHRDLSTRNVLVKSKGLVKVTDFGLSKKLLKYNLYKASPSSKFAWQWQPPEAIALQEFTFKSDVWSFGVTIWEIFSLGNIPWAGSNPQEMFDLIKLGTTLGRPKYAPIQVYLLMLDTWKMPAKYRPSFEEIVDNLSDDNITQITSSTSVSNISGD